MLGRPPRKKMKAATRRADAPLVQLVHDFDLMSARIASFLQLDELGAFSATTRRLRYDSAIGDAFYATSVLCVPHVVPPAEPTFIDGMRPSARALVKRARLADVDDLERAKAFFNAEELHFPDNKNESLSGNQLCPFARLQHCSLPSPGLCGVGFVAHLRHLRSLKLKDVAVVRDWTPLESLHQLETLQLSGATCDTFKRLQPPPNLQELELHDLSQCHDLRCLPVMRQLKTLVVFGGGELQSLEGLTQQQSIVKLRLSYCNVVDCSALRALRQLESFQTHHSRMMGTHCARRRTAR